MITKLFNFYIIKNPHSIDDLEKIKKSILIKLPHELRKLTKILVIDDKPFTPLENLTSQDYRINWLPDVHGLDECQEYNIILVDLKGTGKRFDAREQGLHLIRELKRRYPDKSIIAYSAGASADIVEQAKLEADEFLSKDARIEEWVQVLDASIKSVLDPVENWKKIRDRAIITGVSLFDCALLEHFYIKSLNSKISIIKIVESEKNNFINYNKIKPIVEGLAYGGAIELIKSLLLKAF